MRALLFLGVAAVSHYFKGVLDAIEVSGYGGFRVSRHIKCLDEANLQGTMADCPLRQRYAPFEG